ncbi:MAG: AAA family ATPase [Desulfobacteraceae bacterium]|jgi:hypothetical protein
MVEDNDIFKNGAVWLKADFHMHTRADREYDKKYKDDDQFIQKYIARMGKTDTRIGVITNHNKFDRDEFLALKKVAQKKDICLFPGIEFSLKEGLHLLIVFDDRWYQGQNDNINLFITNAFYGIDNYNTPPYPNSGFSLKETVEALDKIGIDYFLVMPHPDDVNGLFKVLDGRTLEAFIKADEFNKVIALQKSGNRENYNKIIQFTNRELACIEGSDNAQGGIESIGSGRITYVKLGSYSFETLKYCLIDHHNRVRPKEKPEIKNAWIKSISFEGGLLNETKLDFSPELNSFIGIRGSGKSSILEILRYTLGISLSNQASDKDYKNGLIEHVLKSGGKVIVDVINSLKKEYRIEKIYGQKEDIFENNLRIDVPSINTVFQTPVYFGQKDLSSKHIDFEADLIKKLIGNRLDSLKQAQNLKISEIEDLLTQLKKLESLDEIKKEVEASIKDAEYKLKEFKEKGVEEKLKQQSKFESDISRYNDITGELSNFQNLLHDLINNYQYFFQNTKFESDENKEIFKQAEKVFKQISDEFNKLNEIKINIDNYTAEFKKFYKSLQEKKESLKEEFARIKREINVPNLSPDDFLKLNRKIETSKLKLIEIDKSEKRRNELNKVLNDRISELNKLWHDEYKILEKEVSRINEYEKSLSISVEYKGRKDIFEEKLRKIFSGSGIRGATYDNIKSQYLDFIEIYRDFDSINLKLNISDNLISEFKRRFIENYFELLTFRIEDRFTIKYNNKPLGDHSLGQRATALILFLLAQKETDVLIIDQPEDDLDNQTIYEDVIKQIKTLKGNMQFIFATHNANIPVLGDSEKIVSCNYSESKIHTVSGTIDNPETQEQIVTIMEGGEEAFRRRKNIYELWSKK